MPTILTPESLPQLRMRAQGLRQRPWTESTLDAAGRGSSAAADAAHSGSARIAATASRMLAVQGQDWRSARWALGVRSPGTTTADVHEAFATGQIVRSWPMRGTIHIVAAEDIGWLQAATNRRVLAGARRRRETIGLSDADLERLVEVSLAALRGGIALDRDGLAATWTAAGVDWQAGWRYHVIWWMCQNGLTTFGPVHETGEPLLVRVDEWITAPRTLEGDDALAELAARYASARGPVGERDLAWWAGLTLTQTRRAFDLARQAGRVAEARLGDTGGPQLWAPPELLGSAGLSPSVSVPAAESERFADEWWLLPAFDEHLLGYTNRSAQLAPEHLDRIVPGRNGVFQATVVSGGRVRGTWRRNTGAGTGIEVTPFPGEAVDREALAAQASHWGSFTGTDEVALAVLPAQETRS